MSRPRNRSWSIRQRWISASAGLYIEPSGSESCSPTISTTPGGEQRSEPPLQRSSQVGRDTLGEHAVVAEAAAHGQGNQSIKRWAVAGGAPVPTRYPTSTATGAARRITASDR